jgi:WhiB family redox-sensing transcriptional regulator
MSKDRRRPAAPRREAVWQDFAACRGKDVRLFFPADGQTSPLAVATCRRCPVRQACLAEALADPALVGIWGGTTDEQRRRLRNGGGGSPTPARLPAAR